MWVSCSDFIWETTEMTIPLTMEAIAFPKRRESSPTLGVDIPKDISTTSTRRSLRNKFHYRSYTLGYGIAEVFRKIAYS
jgi:hypothetical protein